MIDLARFAKTTEEVAPIVGGWGQVNSRKIYKPGSEDGWYKVHLGSKVDVMRKATLLEIDKTLSSKKSLLAYALGREVVPVNFDNFSRLGFGEAVEVNFLSLPIFEMANVVLWEDNRFYFHEADSKHQRETLRILREKFQNSESIKDVSGVTPELAYYFLLISLESQAYREVKWIERMKLSESEKKKRVAQFQNTLEARLKKTIQNAGGELIRFSKANADTHLVTWKIGGQTVKSTIKDNFNIMSAGFCLSGADREHTLASLVQLAKMFREEKDLYITRE